MTTVSKKNQKITNIQKFIQIKMMLKKFKVMSIYHLNKNQNQANKEFKIIKII